jgi:hypothetical protein
MMDSENHIGSRLTDPKEIPQQLLWRRKKRFRFRIVGAQRSLVHNHPSGDATPSTDDVAMTRAVRVAVEALGIVLHDHVLVGGEQALSFRQEGLL